MSERYIKRGETRAATDEDHLWIMGLLRYTRNVEIITPQPADGFPNITTVFGGLTSRFQPGRLHLFFASYPSTDHARYITAEHKRAVNTEAVHTPNVALHVANTFSKEVTLRMKARARELTRPHEVHAGLLALNAIRNVKGWPPINLGPTNEEDMPRALYAADVLFADTQGERFTERGNHVGEGHPVIDISRLHGFERLPAYPGPGDMPNNKDELFSFLREQQAIPVQFPSLQ